MDAETLRIAWLFPSLAFANYWHPILSEFTRSYPRTRVYTGHWPGFSPGFEDAFTVKIVGAMKFVDTVKSETGYNEGFIQVSPAIITELLQFKPNVIFTTGFCLWTLISILLKPIGGWRVVIAYEGSAPGVDYRNSQIRLFLRRFMTRFTDAFITNSLAGKDYLTQYLQVSESAVFAQPYEVSDPTALLKRTESVNLNISQLHRPIFLFTGQLIPRKGLQQLLEACNLLQRQGYCNYTVLIAGDGLQLEELQEFSRAHGLEDSVKWLGWIGYEKLGAYFRQVDVFILPTLEDTWGMVILEAMAFGKPILCSKWAGASELVIEGENGYLFDPYQPEEIAFAMRRMIDQPSLIEKLGQCSQDSISHHTPVAAAQFLSQVTHTVVGAM